MPKAPYRITLLLVVCTALMAMVPFAYAEDVQRLRTVFFNFPPTLLNDAEQKTEVVTGLTEGAQYQVQGLVQPPFRLVTQSADLVVRNRQLVITAEFRPLSEGMFTTDVFLIRQPVTIGDTIRLRMNGTGYSISRQEIRDFGRVLVGTTDSLIVIARTNLANNERWRYDPPTLPPPFEVRPTNGPFIRNDTAFFQFRFSPQAIGKFADTLTIVRLSGAQAVEEIVVILRGTGVPFVLRDTVDLGTILTGDTVARTRTFKPPVVRPEYSVHHKPSPPFYVYLDKDGKPIPTPTDSMMVGCAFKPTTPGKYADSVVLYRMSQTLDVVDTVTFHLRGAAERQQTEASAEFSNMMVDSIATQNLGVLIPLESNIPFTYRVVPTNASPVQGTVGTVGNASVQIALTCAPTVYQQRTEQTLIVQRLAGDVVVDSTTITVTTTMVPRPVRLFLWADTTEARIGDPASIVVRMQTIGVVDAPVEVGTMTLRLGYNPTLFVPEPAVGVERNVDADSAHVVATAENVLIEGNTSITLATVAGVVTMGDADRCVLNLGVDVDQPGMSIIQPTVANGLLVLSNAWRYSGGGGRYVNSLQGQLTLDIDPNPVVSQSVLRVRNAPTGAGRLIIVDAVGHVVSDLTADLRSGIREWTIGKSGGSAVALGAGTYYARVTATGTNDTELYSVTRLFIVQ